MIVGGMCFYEDEPWLLEHAVESIARTGAQAIVAVDGAYAAFPGGRAESSEDRHDALLKACAKHSIEITFHFPRSVWKGNEVEKRQAMIEFIRETYGVDEVWMLVHDTDYVIETARDLPHLLDEYPTDSPYASARFYEHFQDDGSRVDIPFVQTIRCLARIAPDLRMGTNHYTYLRSDIGRSWQIVSRDGLHVPGFELEHRRHDRDPERLAAQTAYYHIRDSEGLES